MIKLNEFAVMLAKFDNLPTEKKEDFFKHYKNLKEEFKVISEENSILKEGLNTVRGVQQ